MEIKRYDCGVRFATAVEYNGMVYTSGLVTSDRTGDITAQTKDVLSKIDAALEKAGSDKDHVIMVNIWIADMKLFGEMNAVWDEWVSKENMPVRACVESKLAGNGNLVEIAAIAVKK